MEPNWTVIHFEGDFSLQTPPQNSILVKTCLRTILIGLGTESSLYSNQGIPYRGRDAYEFLLLFASGLLSPIVGETDVFGQFKDAWKKFKENSLEASTAFEPWIQNLIADTKDIRKRYLENLGGHSYATLLKKHHPKACDNTLLIGAGSLGTSLAPYISTKNLWIWNRNPERAQKLAASLNQHWVSSLEHKKSLWKSADSVVIAIPTSPDAEERRKSWLPPQKNIPIFHFGCHETSGPWKNYPDFFSLHRFFETSKILDEKRKSQAEKAKNFCKERAMLRSLHSSVCWEDLSAFY